MSKIYYKSVPFCKEDVTLALESGVDGVIVPGEHVETTSTLSRISVWAEEQTPSVLLTSKADEEAVCARLCANERVVLARGWEVIPVENLLARSGNVLVEAATLDEARLASGILQCGVAGVVVQPEGLPLLKTIIEQCRQHQGSEPLQEAVVTRVATAGLGHRVCVDTLSLFHRGQGMLVGNSSAFTFLVHAETEANEYVAARPFRVNAGGVHAYVRLPGDTTCYLEELRAGREVLAVHADGSSTLVSVGRVKVEVRPMLLIEARIGDVTGSVFLQNAETIRLTKPGGEPVSVVQLRAGDTVLCRMDEAGRHFGMRVHEDIQEL